MALDPGTIVRTLQTGLTAWVICRPWPDGRYYMRSKVIDDHGRASYTARIAGGGDLIEVSPAPVYEPGATIKRDGVSYTVDSDLGDEVVLIVPETTFNHQSGVRFRVPSGNRTTVHKSDLALEGLK